jgi:hypothetical protein
MPSRLPAYFKLHPTANSSSCKFPAVRHVPLGIGQNATAPIAIFAIFQGYGQAVCRNGRVQFEVFDGDNRGSHFKRTTTADSRQSCRQTSCVGPLLWPWKIFARAEDPSARSSPKMAASSPKASIASRPQTIRRRTRKLSPFAKLAGPSVTFSSLDAIFTPRASLVPCVSVLFIGRVLRESFSPPLPAMLPPPDSTMPLFMTS